MAARGLVHSAVSFQGRSGLAENALIGRFVLCARAKRFVCHLLVSRELSRTRRLANRRSMASTPVPASCQSRPSIRSSARTKYEEAVMALNSLQSNAETIRKASQDRNASRKHNIPNMINYLGRVGLSVDDIDKLHVIHVTGTKGKGSTCAFAEIILRQYGFKTGIFSSPHLIEARERIHIDGRPIDRDLFSTCFWDVYNMLMSTKEQNNGMMPHYFGFLTVMAFYVFVWEKVDVVLLEVGIGGEYDSTNVIGKPIVCGISSLDLDHTNLLGQTLDEIAWHKSGIFKRGAPGITVPQPESPLSVILNRSKEIGCPLYVAQPLQAEELSAQHLVLGITGDRQRYNAALAVQLCQFWLQLHSKSFEERLQELENQSSVTSASDIPKKITKQLSEEMIRGLSRCQLAGRTQTIKRPGVTYYLDGAHTTDSMQQCVEWFQQAARKEQNLLGKEVCRALVFNMTGDRPVSQLMKLLQGCGFHRAAFCPNYVSTSANENIPDQMNLTVEQETMMKKSIRNLKIWKDLFLRQNTPCKNGFADHVGSHTPAENSGPRLVLDGEMGDQTSEKSENDYLSESLSTLPRCESAQFPCITSALHWATQNQDLSFTIGALSVNEENLNLSATKADKELPHIQVLVTGSLHLVGGVLGMLTPDMNE